MLMTEVELQINVSKEGNLLLNPERINLLRFIQETRSLLTASKEVGISYNKAWRILDSMNAATDKPLVRKLRGGKGGGGALLTDYGRVILNEYVAIEGVVSEFTKKLNTEINL